jgi:hypothetical protein
MAIVYGAKLAESTTAATTVTVTTGAAIKAGSLIVVAFGGRASAALSASSFKYGDTSFTLHQRSDSVSLPAPQCIGLAYWRTPSAIASGASLVMTWSRAPTVSWVSVHSFEGATGTAHDTGSANGTATSWVAAVDVTGSDWLSVAAVSLPFEYNVSSSGANSSTERDTNGASSEGTRPWMGVASYNGTTGATHSPGLGGSSRPFYTVSVSFGYEAAGGGGGGGQNSGLWGV